MSVDVCMCLCLGHFITVRFGPLKRATKSHYQNNRANIYTTDYITMDTKSTVCGALGA